MKRKSDYFDRGVEEERWNYITHGIAAILMLSFAVHSEVLAGRVLSLVLAFTFLASCFYHAALDISLKEKLRKIDMASIYLSIGATASAYCYTIGSPVWNLPIFIGLVLFVSGLVLYGEAWDRIMVPLSITFASISITLFFVTSFVSDLTSAAIYFYVGNLMYSAGLWFYVRDKVRYFHTIWHIFVTLGAVIHSSYYFCI